MRNASSVLASASLTRSGRGSGAGSGVGTFSRGAGATSGGLGNVSAKSGALVGVLIFGFLSNILQLNNIDSNTQLVLKGLIILAAVLLQEGQAGRLLGPLRGLLRGPPRAPG